jgi:hypothetical protein
MNFDPPFFVFFRPKTIGQPGQDPRKILHEFIRVRRQCGFLFHAEFFEGFFFVSNGRIGEKRSPGVKNDGKNDPFFWTPLNYWDPS